MPDFCAYYKQNICRSCTLMEMPYPEQLRRKEDRLRNALKDFSPPSLLPSLTSPETGFRNKAKFIVSGSMEKPILGLIGKEILDCPVHDPAINLLAHDLVSFLSLCKLVPYNIPEKKGELKGVIVFHEKGSFVRFVLRSKEGLDRIRKNLPDLLKVHPEIQSVSVNIQPIHQAILEGEEEIFLGPQFVLTLNKGEGKILLRPQGFVQTNQIVAHELYQNAARWVKETGSKKFLELFSGQGAFSLTCAGVVEKGLGIEINTEAVLSANESARQSGYNHLSFHAMDAGDSEKLIQDFHPDMILVNPPRRGLSRSVDHLLAASTEWIIYSSCSVESLAEDLRKLSTQYKIEKLRLFDMFPHTEHFETLVLLRRISSIKT